MEEPTTVTGWGLPIPKLKSLVAFFFGIFCILCFKKLIGFGRRWKNILIDWGYRSLNFPSLWSSDAFADQNGLEQSFSSIFNKERDIRSSKRVPALRLPDAWPNFLLTWMYLNLNTISGLVPAWISAINEELKKLTTRPHLNGIPGSHKNAGRCTDLKLEAVRQPSAPPRLSSIETFASGSTKELHFHCTLSCPEVFLELTLTRTGSSELTDGVSQAEKYLAQLQQISCRAQIICAVLEGDYVLLSWKIASPLLMQPLSLFGMDMQPVTKLSGADVRWIKDSIYLGIQSAMTRIVLSPLCLTPVQQSPTTTLPLTSILIRKSNKSLDTQIAGAQADEPIGPSDPLCPSNAMHIRVLYAVLLEPMNLDSLDPLVRYPLRCRIRWNLSLVQSDESSVSVDSPETTLLTTSGVRLEPGDPSRQSIPFLSGRFPTVTSPTLSGSLTNAYTAVWNQDAFIPMRELFSDLLDVVLFTEPDDKSDPSASICGHAILPLPKSNDNPSKGQHMLRIDCRQGNPNDDWQTYYTKSSEIRAKFMLFLRVQLSSDPSAVSEPSDRVDIPNRFSTDIPSTSEPVRKRSSYNSESTNSYFKRRGESNGHPVTRSTEQHPSPLTHSSQDYASVAVNTIPSPGDGSRTPRSTTLSKKMRKILHLGKSKHEKRANISSDLSMCSEAELPTGQMSENDPGGLATSPRPASLARSKTGRSTFRRLLGWGSVRQSDAPKRLPVYSLRRTSH